MSLEEQKEFDKKHEEAKKRMELYKEKIRKENLEKMYKTWKDIKKYKTDAKERKILLEEMNHLVYEGILQFYAIERKMKEEEEKKQIIQLIQELRESHQHIEWSLFREHVVGAFKNAINEFGDK